MRKRIILILPVLLSGWFAIKGGATEDPFLRLPDSHSAAFSEGPNANLLNPVFADITGAPVMSYRYLAYEDKKNGSHIASLGTSGFLFTYGRFGSVYSSEKDEVLSPAINFYNISKGFFFNNSIGFGVGYSFGTSHDPLYDRYKSLSAGFLLRPAWYVSFGAAVNGIYAAMGGEKLKHREVYSAAIRPFTERITLSTDAERFSGQSFKDVLWSFGVNLRIFRDINLFAKANRDYLNFGLSLPLYAGSPRVIMDVQGGSLNDSVKAGSAGLTLRFKENGEGIYPYSGKILTLNLESNLKEFEKKSIFRKGQLDLTDIVMGIKRASEDDSVAGLVINVNNIGFAHAQEIRNAIKNFRAAGKTVYATTANPGNTAYYIAASADKIYYAPNSMFGLTGLSANVYFFKTLMAKIGVSFDVFKHGKYKSAYESFTDEKMSDAARENITSIISDLNEQFISDIKADRKLSDEAIRRLFDEGLLNPEDSKKLGFIDEEDYYEQALESIKKETGCRNITGFTAYINENKRRNASWGAKPVIAIVHVDGAIFFDKPALSGGGIGSAAYIDMLEQVFKDDSVEAVIIRVSSGGGSALASDFMQNALVGLQKKYPKPVIFSFGGIAASGGYYIACADGEILASPGTLTGSIGVIAGKLTADEFYAKIGVNKETVKINEMDDIFSESRKLTAKERAVIQKEVEFIYDRFTGKVMEFRGIPKEKIPYTAEGRVFTGRQAKENGLVDRLGGLAAAVELAAKKAEIKNYELKELPHRKFSLTDILMSEDVSAIKESLEPVIKNYDLLKLSSERTLLITPYSIEIE